MGTRVYVCVSGCAREERVIYKLSLCLNIHIYRNLNVSAMFVFERVSTHIINTYSLTTHVLIRFCVFFFHFNPANSQIRRKPYVQSKLFHRIIMVFKNDFRRV